MQLKQPPRRIRNHGLLATSLHCYIKKKLPGSIRFALGLCDTLANKTVPPPALLDLSPYPDVDFSFQSKQESVGSGRHRDSTDRLSELISFCDPLRRDRWSRRHVGHPARPPPHRTRTVPSIPYYIPAANRSLLPNGDCPPFAHPPIIDRRQLANSLALSPKPQAPSPAPFLFSIC